MLEPGRQQVPCRVKSAGARVKRVIFGLGEAGRPDQQGPRRIEAPRSDLRRKPLGATLFGLGRLHRLDEQRVDKRGNGRSGFSVLRRRRASRKGAESRAFWLFLLLWEYRERSEALSQGATAACGRSVEVVSDQRAGEGAPLPPGEQPLSRAPKLIPNHPDHDREPESLRRYRL